MFTDVQVANFALSELGASLVNQLSPPRSPLERHIARNYDYWRRAELTRRIWVFARELYMPFTLTETKTGEDRPYVYVIPSNVLRIVRRDGDEWEQEGTFVRSNYDTLQLYVIKDVPTPEFAASFVPVMSWRIASGSAEFITQSNTKTNRADAQYDAAVREAAKINAWVKPPVPYTDSDEGYPFVTERAFHNGL